MQSVSPYRVERPLDTLIAPDRRRLYACVLAFTGVVVGAVLLRAVEVAVEQSADAEPARWSPRAKSFTLKVGYDTPVAVPFMYRDSTSKLDQARDVLLTNPALSKQLLMPIVASGRDAPDEVR